MMSTDRASELQSRYRVAVILGLAMIGGLVLYAVLVEVIRAYHRPFTGFAAFQPVAAMKWIFLVISAAQIPFIQFLRGVLLKVPDGNRDALLQRLMSTTVITFASCEVPAILGLVLFLTGGLWREFYLFWGLSLVLMVLYFPRVQSWRELLSDESET